MSLATNEKFLISEFGINFNEDSFHDKALNYLLNVHNKLIYLIEFIL